MEHVPPKTQVLREKLGKGVGIKWGEGVGINPIGEGGSGGLRQLTLCSVQGAEDLLQNKRERLVHAVPGRARRRQNTEKIADENNVMIKPFHNIVIISSHLFESNVNRCSMAIPNLQRSVGANRRSGKHRHNIFVRERNFGDDPCVR